MTEADLYRLREAARATPGPRALGDALRAWGRAGRGLEALEALGDPALLAGEEPVDPDDPALEVVASWCWQLGLGLGDPRFHHGVPEDSCLGRDGEWVATVDAGGVLRRYDLRERRLVAEDHLVPGRHGLLRQQGGVVALTFQEGERPEVLAEVSELGGEPAARRVTLRGLGVDAEPDGAGVGWVARAGAGGRELTLLSQLQLRDLGPGTHRLSLPRWRAADGVVPGQVWMDASGRWLLLEPLEEMQPRCRLVDLEAGKVVESFPGVVAAVFSPQGDGLALLRCRYESQEDRWEIRERYTMEVVDLPGLGSRWDKELENLPSVSFSLTSWPRDVRWEGVDILVDGIAYAAANGLRRKTALPEPGRRVSASGGTLWVRRTHRGLPFGDDPNLAPAFGPVGHRDQVVAVHTPVGAGHAWTEDADEVFRAWDWTSGRPSAVLATHGDRFVVARGGRFGLLAPFETAGPWTVKQLPDGPVVGLLDAGLGSAGGMALDLSPDGARVLLATDDRVEVHVLAPVEAEDREGERPPDRPGDVLGYWLETGCEAVAWDRRGRVALAMRPGLGKATWRDLDAHTASSVELPTRGEGLGWVHDPLGPGVLVGLPGAPLVRLEPDVPEAVEVVPVPLGPAGFRVAPDGSCLAIFEAGRELSLWRPGEVRPYRRLRELDGEPQEYALGPDGVVLRSYGAGARVVAAGS